MKLREFLAVVPKSFKRVAAVVAVCCVAAGLVVAMMIARQHGNHLPALMAPQGLAFGLLAGVLACSWVSCLGYVYADARRRAMPPLLWTLVAAFIPNLLGFLLYFACRRPVALPCPHCGKPVVAEQRFCAWCGEPASTPLASGGMLA